MNKKNIKIIRNINNILPFNNHVYCLHKCDSIMHFMVE